MTPRGATPRTRLTILFLTVFVDLVGFGIVLPLLPLYAERFGADGLTIGFLITSYSAAQFFLSPVWGRLSDRWGRRPIILVGLVGSGISYLVFAYATSLTALFVSRVLAGIAGANVSVAQAYIADVTPPERRAGTMGLIGAAFGLGFIFGPALGGILAPVAFEAPGLAAAALCFANAGLAVFRLPESLTTEERRARVPTLVPHRSRFAVLVEYREIWRVLAISFLFTTAFAAMQPTFPIFGARRFDLDARHMGYVFAYMGLISAVMQGVLVRRLAPALGEATLVRVAGVAFTAGLLAIAASRSVAPLLVGVFILALGFGAMIPTLASLVSRSAGAGDQGTVLGVAESIRALARIIGPILAGAVFDGLGMVWPYLAGAALGAGALALAPGIRVPREGEAGGEPDPS